MLDVLDGARPGRRSTASISWAARRRAWRERRMVSLRSRIRLADSLDRAIERAAVQGPSAFSSALPVSPEAAGEAHAALLDLSERLRAPRAVDSAGVRLVRTLLTDGTGPLFYPGRTGTGALRAAARQALQALDPSGLDD